MKKTILTLTALLSLNVSAAFAAPINDLSQGQTAVGLGTDTFYVEHQINNGFTLGFQNQDKEGVGDMDDLYGQFKLSDNLRGIVGSRDFGYSSKFYLGAAVNGPLNNQWNGYASLIAGSEFKELQVGANYNLSHNADFNLSYSSFMPDGGSNKSDVGVGVTFKF